MAKRKRRYTRGEPFSIVKRKDRIYYYVAFKDKLTGEFGSAISTKKTTEAEARETAWAWYHNGIPQKGKTVLSLEFQSIMNSLVSYLPKMTPDEKKALAEKLKAADTYAVIVQHGDGQAVDFTEYILNYWDYDNSKVIKQKNSEGSKTVVHKRHAADMLSIARKYWVPYFKGKLLGEIDRPMVKAFRQHLNEVVLPNGKPLSPGRKTMIMEAGGIPLKRSYTEGEIPANPALGLIQFHKESKGYKPLPHEWARKIFSIEWPDQRVKLGNLLAMWTGMRVGEIQALRLEDLGKDVIFVRHSWNLMDGLKPPKNGLERTVQVLPWVIPALKELASQNPHGVENPFVFWADILPGKPMEDSRFRNGMKTALRKCGMPEEEVKDYSFHGWRKFYTASLKGKLSDKLLKFQTGHLSDEMLNYYGDYVVPGDVEKIRQEQLNVFKDLLPERLLPSIGDGLAPNGEAAVSRKVSA